MSALLAANAPTLDIDADDRFDVREFTVDDGLSALFSVEILALSSNPAVDFEQIVGKPATFRVHGHAAAGHAAHWHGIIGEIHQIRSEDSGLSTYHLTLVPRLWLLTQRTNCRVFQQMTDLDVVRAILAEWGIEPKVEAARSYKTRKYRVQYQETDYAFACRLLEASGVTFFHRRADDSKLVLSDAVEQASSRHAPLDHTNAPLGANVYATDFRASRTVRSGRVTFADHDHRMPNTPLLAHAQTGAHPLEAKLERFVYTPGAFRFGNKGPKDTPHADDRGRTRTDPDEGRRIAEQAASAGVARSRRFAFESNALDLAAGTVLHVAGHPLAEREGKLLVTHVSINGTHETEPHLSVKAVSAGTAWRPDMVTRAPSISGVECATVVGPAGETIHCDEFGRVRVQFHWDRYGTMDEQSSCWVPVNQPWAGDAQGALNLPRIGQEVIVGFLGGDPEEPVVVGRLFTNLLRPPFPLPLNKTQNGFKSASVPATGGYNELMFEDKAGHELIRTRAERDKTTRVNRNQDLSVGNDRSAHVEKNDRERVSGNQDHLVEGKMNSAVLGQMTGHVGADQLLSVIGNMLSTVGAERILQTIGPYLSEALSHKITSQVGTTLAVGQSMIHIGPDAIVIQSPKVLLNPGEEIAASVAMGGTVPTPSE